MLDGENFIYDDLLEDFNTCERNYWKERYPGIEPIWGKLLKARIDAKSITLECVYFVDFFANDPLDDVHKIVYGLWEYKYDECTWAFRDWGTYKKIYGSNI